MYRQRPEQEKEQQFVSRLLTLPLVATAMDQVNVIYTSTKERNRLLKMTMETAETGVSAVIGTAAPVISKFERPLTSLNDFAYVQLEKLEIKYPIITKPTDEVVKATKDLCNTAVKPFVDGVSSAKQFGLDKVSNVYSFTGEKLGDIKNYGFLTVGAVVKLGNDQMARILAPVANHHMTKRVDDLVDTADRYVDSYLPPDEAEAKEKEGEKEEGKESDVVVVSKAFRLGSKVQKRMWSRTVKQMKVVQMRSRETLHKLNFTVDLIEYARTNFNEGKEKVGSVWDEINKTEEEVAKEETDKEATHEKSSFERKAIATARQLTLKLKRTLSWLHIPQFAVGTFPEAINIQIQSLQDKAHMLANIFSKENTDSVGLTKTALENARNFTSQILVLVSNLPGYGIVERHLGWKATTSEQTSEDHPPGEKDDQVSNSSQEDN